jgi:imidazolonepropionase-like amidohydrolase
MVFKTSIQLQFFKLIIAVLISLGLFTPGNISAQSEGVPTPAPKQSASVLFKGGVLHIGNGQIVDNSVVGIRDGKITVAGPMGMVPFIEQDFQEVIELNGKHIYPGFIAPNSTLGLREIDAVRATRDFHETGAINPHVRSIIAYNTESRITPTLRNNGVLIAQTTPRYGLISGTSSIVELDGWNWQDAVYKMDDGLHLYWPNMFRGGGWWAEPGTTEKNKDYDKHVNELRSFFSDAKAYAQIASPKNKNLKLEAVRGLFNGTQTLFINSDYVKELIQAINLTREMGIKRVVIIGGADAHLITDMLKENKVSVIVQRTHSLPGRADDDIDLPFKLPYLLQQAGILYCLNYEGDMEVMGTRNLPFTAGTAAAYGLTKEQAVMSITLNAAKILGIDKTLGSIEAGKDATLFISTGDALDMRTNNVEAAYIRGRKISLDDPQRQLFRKYSAKYGLE